MKRSKAQIRHELRKIKNNSSLSETERGKQCQRVLNASTSSSGTALVSNFSKTCSHYQKKCSRFKFDCCNIVDPCNRCHLARECCTTNPPRISSIVCDECEYEQQPSPHCVQCGVQFSHNHCSICKIWTALDISHCYDCGCCRVGRVNTNFHCHKCDACFEKSYRSTHICSKAPLRFEICSYCLENIHNCQETTTGFGCCNIYAHEHCILQAGQHGNYRCPRCRKSFFVMTDIWNHMRMAIEEQPIEKEMFAIEIGFIYQTTFGPFQIESVSIEHGSSEEEMLYSGSLVNWVLSDNTCPRATLKSSTFLDRLVWTWCNQCEKKSLTSFHWLGLECKLCRGFNTMQC